MDDYSLHKLWQYRTTRVQPVARKLSITCLKVHFCGVDIRDGKTAKHNVWNPKYPIYSPYVYLDLRLSIHWETDQGRDLQLFKFLRVSCSASNPRAAIPNKFHGGRSSNSKLARSQVDLTGASSLTMEIDRISMKTDSYISDIYFIISF